MPRHTVAAPPKCRPELVHTVVWTDGEHRGFFHGEFTPTDAWIETDAYGRLTRVTVFGYQRVALTGFRGKLRVASFYRPEHVHLLPDWVVSEIPAVPGDQLQLHFS